MRKYEWILCPGCGNKTRVKICDDTHFYKSLVLNYVVMKFKIIYQIVLIMTVAVSL
ncbi:cysteine-rich KTR domain-containing protein [Clostridium sp.]|uniref:cysteine-rich KTR domain-containing protein n=1 Tax=Clostridium sp. TaxID=1506 RepID=UPI003463A262